MAEKEPTPDKSEEKSEIPSFIEGELTDEELRQVSGGGGVGNNIKLKPVNKCPYN